MSDPVLVIDHVTKRFGDFTAVNDLSLSVPKGSVYGFLGPNGAGKTTTIRMVLAIYEPTQGSISVLGKPSALDVRDRIGYLPEEKGLYKKMTGVEIIAYFAMLKGLKRSEAKARAIELLDRYGLGEFKDRKCEALSKGMGQKVQVLASIAHRPEFVILDEPFSGLDPVNQQVLEQVIKDMSTAGATIIFSTHIMEHAERLCDRIVLIARGKRLFDGTIAEARRLVPRRLLIRTNSDPSLLRRVPGVLDLKPNGADGAYEIALAEGANADDVLTTSFQSGIALRSFDRSEPGLRDVFLKLVGVDQAEEVVS